jgi:excisionase family DNA binding protein
MSGLSAATLYRLMDRGELDTVKVGRRRLVKVDSIKRLVGAA